MIIFSVRQEKFCGNPILGVIKGRGNLADTRYSFYFLTTIILCHWMRLMMKVCRKKVGADIGQSVLPIAYIHLSTFGALNHASPYDFVRISTCQRLDIDSLHQRRAATPSERLDKRQIDNKAFIIGKTVQLFHDLKNLLDVE